MADEWETIKAEMLDEIAKARQASLEEFQMLEKILETRVDKARQNEMLTELKKVTARLDKIESRLSDEDKVDSAKGIGR